MPPLPPGIAILGAGLFAKEAYIPALARLGSGALPLLAVYSRSESSSKQLAETAAEHLKLKEAPAVYHDGEESKNLASLLKRKDISAVIVVLPITTQPDIIITALQAGKHVLSEKPVAKDVASGLELINKYRLIYQPQGLVWRVAENFEAEDIYRSAALVINSGTIGHIQTFKATGVDYVDKTSKWYQTPWRTVPDYQGGFLLDGGVHTTAALRTMLSRNFTKLSGLAALNKDFLFPHDTIHTIVQAGEGVHGTVEMTFAHPLKEKPKADHIVVTGSKGWLSVNKNQAMEDGIPIHRIVVRTLASKDGESTQEIIEKKSNGVEAELTSFFDAIHGKETLAIGDPLDALRDVAFIQAALNSNGSQVDLEKLVNP